MSIRDVLLLAVAILAVALMDAWLRVIRHRNGTRVLEGDIARARRELAHVGGQRAIVAEVLKAIDVLRGELVERGAVERSAKLPPSPVASAPPPPLPSVARKVVSVTRDDHPDHTRATVVSPPPAGAVGSEDDASPRTKPSESRTIPASTPPRSLPRPVSFDERIRRALARMPNRIKVPPRLEERWLARLQALGAELEIDESTGPTEEQVHAMIRELYQADADDRDARDAPGGRAVLETLPSPDDDLEAERETGEDLTYVMSRDPGAADAQIPGLVVVPVPRRPPHPRPRRIGDTVVTVTPEAPTSSRARSAEALTKSERPTLFGGLPGGAAPRPGPREPKPGSRTSPPPRDAGDSGAWIGLGAALEGVEGRLAVPKTVEDRIVAKVLETRKAAHTNGDGVAIRHAGEKEGGETA